jgi:hypothetical protein
LPADELFTARRAFSVETATDDLREALRVGLPEITCDLGNDWRFDEIRKRVVNRPACSFRERPIERPSRQLALIAHALEEELLDRHHGLSTSAIAAFWTSWSVWNYLAESSRKISLELKRRSYTGDYDPVLGARAIRAQAWRFSRGAHESTPALVLGRHAASSSTSPPGPEPYLPVVAANLRALQLEAKLSDRKLARKIGPVPGDHKAVAKHCKGLRVPEDRTIAVYAQAFTRILGRVITADQIRNEDLTAPRTDSIT